MARGSGSGAETARLNDYDAILERWAAKTTAAKISRALGLRGPKTVYKVLERARAAGDQRAAYREAGDPGAIYLDAAPPIVRPAPRLAVSMTEQLGLKPETIFVPTFDYVSGVEDDGTLINPHNFRVPVTVSGLTGGPVVYDRSRRSVREAALIREAVKRAVSASRARWAFQIT